MPDTESTRYTIIYIDDEEKALRYFKDAYSDEYDILTARSAEEGWERIQQHAGELTIIMTDQRMPGEQGVDLLVKAREHYPRIMRLLATAYADLDSAIASVNDGFIYHYITKPWDEVQLRVILKKTLDYWKLVRDRDTLIKEKITVLKRMAVIDRVKSLSFLAAGLSHSLHNSIAAVYSFTDKMLHYLKMQGRTNCMHSNGLYTAYLVNQGLAARLKLDEMIEATHKISEATLQPSQVAFVDSIEVGDVLISAKEAFLKEEEGRLTDYTLCIHHTLTEGLPPLCCNQAMVEKLVPLLLKSLCHDFGSNDLSIRLSAAPEAVVSGTEGCRITVIAEGRSWSTDQIQAMFSVFKDHTSGVSDGLGLLTAFFLTHHHGGDIKIINKPEKGAGYDVLLPFDPKRAKCPALEENFLEKIITHFEEDDIAAL